jgi:alpha-glucosidase
MTLGRDGARTPMPWLAELPLGGFTTGEPWLPLSAGNIARAAKAQLDDGGSLLNETKRLLGLRRNNAALRIGGIENVVASVALLHFDRLAAGQRLRCLFNLSPASCKPEGIPANAAIMASVNSAAPERMPGYSALFLSL